MQRSGRPDVSILLVLFVLLTTTLLGACWSEQRYRDRVPDPDERRQDESNDDSTPDEQETDDVNPEEADHSQPDEGDSTPPPAAPPRTMPPADDQPDTGWQRGAFPIYQNVAQKRSLAVESLATGVPWIPMIANRDFRAHPDGSYLELSEAKIVAAIDKMGLPDGYTGMILLDYEPWVTRHWERERGTAAMIESVHIVRRRLPRAKIALFGIPTTRIPNEDRSQRVRPESDYWTEVWPVVDFIAPQVYTGNTNWPAGVIRRHVTKALEVGETWNKPVVPVVRGRTTKEEWIPVPVFHERIEFIRDLGADGVIVWDAKKSRDDDPDRGNAERLSAVRDVSAARSEGGDE